MLTFPYRVGGDAVTIRFPEHPDELAAFEEFLRRTAGQIIGLDTENTDLHIYGPQFRGRLVQFGTVDEAWCIPVEWGGAYREAARRALMDPNRKFVVHNAPYDLLVFDRTGLAPLADLGPRVFDTYLLGHLCDPRMLHQGGTGLKLKELSKVYVDPGAADTQDGLHAVFRKEYKATKHTGWAVIDLTHPLYLTYAGLDVIYASRLLRELGTLVKGNGLSKLAHWEHRVQLLTTAMMKRGLRIDPVYTAQLVAELHDEAARHRSTAAEFGVANVNSNAQVIAALQGMGEEWSETTDSGAPSVSKDVLLPMADLGMQWERLDARAANPVADAVVRAKRASKWADSYAQAFLDKVDDQGRIHPSIRSLAARTARMSVSDPALQQLPSSDWTIRRCIVADPGQLIVAADYSQVEMRVLAALSRDAALMAAIASGEDLHTFTARLVSGAAWEYMDDKARKKARKLFKAVGFGKVYGGGAVTLSRQTGAPLADVRVAVAEYDKAFPGIKAYGRRLQRGAAYGGQEVVTPFGRHLPLDRDRAYAATNYVVQSTARDLLAKALCDLDDAGLSEYVLLPVHDELVCQAPAEDARDVIHSVGRIMESTFGGVAITSEAEVYGPSWGHGYGYAEAA
ncbi:DNA polymerase [Kribbella sp. NPDC056345]|uniref:DNA polymerase n=1 Tax=Kribbella sp. NPDC056345 TaxID=3345789 RepID=UPI0035DAAC30